MSPHILYSVLLLCLDKSTPGLYAIPARHELVSVFPLPLLEEGGSRCTKVEEREGGAGLRVSWGLSIRGTRIKTT
jgi:hypothetical protein